MKGKKILAVLLMFVMIFAMTACGGGASGEDKVYNLKISLEPSESNFMAENWREWADAVTEASDGRLQFTFYYDNTLVDANAQYQQLVSGVADIADVHRYASDGFVITENWKLLTAGIPVDQQTSLSYKFLEEFPDVADEFKDVKILAHTYSGGGAYDILTVDKEVKTPADLKGMTIWCEADWNEFIKACGATPVNTPFSEVYSSLQKNMYDGMLIPTETLQSCNFAEVCKYCVKLNLSYASAPGHLMNMDTWNSLPDDIKEIIDSEEIRSVVEKANVEGFKAAEEGAMEWAEETYGTKEVVLTDQQHDEFMELVKEANLEKAAELDSKGLPGTEIVEALAKWTAEWK